VGRVDDELAIDAADAHRADRAGEGDVGEAEGGGSAVHREDVGVVFTIGAEQEGDDLGVVEITFGEQRAQRAVRHAAGEDFLFGGAAFALEVATGKTPAAVAFSLYSTESGNQVWPDFTLVAETAVTRMMVSPQRTVTAPSASLAILPVSIVISGGFEVIQKFPATRHHFEQTTPSGVVFGVGVEVLGEVIDALRQQGDLDVCTTGVLFVELKSAKGGGLGFAHGIDGSPPW
jgi:hypothetical protein